MMVERKPHIVLAWWNTGLSPLGKSRATQDDKRIAAAVVRALTRVWRVDCLAVGEVTCDDLNYFKSECPLTGYGILDNTIKSGRLQWDLGLIYDMRRLEIRNETNIISNYAGHSLKVAQRIDFIIRETFEPLHLYVLHWPSRLHPDPPKSDTLGLRLRDDVDKLRRQYGEMKEHGPNCARIVIIGDFNEEPFDEPIAGHLLASRDRTLVRKDNRFLYNPFWRRLGETDAHNPNREADSVCGTYFHRNGTQTKWRTFDQIIVSSSFLDKDQWYLNEEYTDIIRMPFLNDIVRHGQRIFDHLPVIGVIQRKTNKDDGGNM